MIGWLKLLALPALMLLGFYMIDSRAEQRGRDEALVLQSKQKQIVQDTAKVIEDRLKADAVLRDQKLYDKLKTLRSVDKTTLIKEIKSETRFSDPTLGITDGMLDTLNQARSLTGASSTVDGSEGPVPRFAPVEGSDN